MSAIDILKANSPIALTADTFSKLAVVADRLQSENKKYNLTALTDDEDIALLHFADCLQLVKHIDFSGKSVIDIGCGGGFPALVLAAAEPTLKLTALDSTAKKLVFVAETASLAGINNLETLCARAEEIADGVRESYDIAVARGVTRLAALCELCLPYVKLGGTFVAMKGSAGAEEAAEAAKAIKTLGGTLAEIIKAPVPIRGDEHCLVVIKKVAPTPAKYPRAWGQIKKNPITGK